MRAFLVKVPKTMHDIILYRNTGEVTLQADYLSSFIITYPSCWTCRKTGMHDFIFKNLFKNTTYLFIFKTGVYQFRKDWPMSLKYEYMEIA